MQQPVSKFIEEYGLKSLADLVHIINKYRLQLNPELVYMAADYLNPNKESTAAYYTDKIICEEIFRELPLFESKEIIHVLEPSVGAGAFLPFIAEKYKDKKQVKIWINDIDNQELQLAKLIFNTFYQQKYSNVSLYSINDDFLKLDFKDRSFDLIIGNPPYQKIKSTNSKYKFYKTNSQIKKTTNLFVYFFEKALAIGKIISLVIPKSLLNAPEYSELRNLINQYKIESIIDFGESGFKGVKIETINLIVNTQINQSTTRVKSVAKNLELVQEQSYITDSQFPTWLIYRNQAFDEFASQLKLGIFTAFRDRQITSKMCQNNGKYRVLRSRNIQANKVININNYDKYLDNIDNFPVAEFLNKVSVVCMPNLSYSPRACFLPRDCVADGSVALLTTEDTIIEDDLEVFATSEFRSYYQIARNYGTRSLNIDSNSVYYFGIRRKK